MGEQAARAQQLWKLALAHPQHKAYVRAVQTHAVRSGHDDRVLRFGNMAQVRFVQQQREQLGVFRCRHLVPAQKLLHLAQQIHHVFPSGVQCAGAQRVARLLKRGGRLCGVLRAAESIQQQIQLTFSQIMKAAVHDRLYPANLLEDLKDVMKPIDYKADEKRPLTENEKNAMVKAELSPSDRIFVDILYCTGLRCGEVLALTRFDIDFSEKVINVNKAVEFDDAGKPSIKEPKSKNGFRQVPIPPQLYTSLESYVRFCIKGTLLFSMQGGKMVSKSSYRRKWERIIKEMNRVAEKPVCGLTAHIFRHNYCTSLCYQIPRISIKNIASLLGDDEAMVLRIYNHIMLEKEDTAGAVEAALSM